MSYMAINSVNNVDLSVCYKIVSQQAGIDKIKGEDKTNIAKLLEGIAINRRIENIQTLQNMAAYLVSLKASEAETAEEIEAYNDKQAEEAKQEAEASVPTADEMAENEVISETVKQDLYQLLTKVGSKLSALKEFDPSSLLTGLFGVEPKDYSEGVTNGDFSVAYENFFKNFQSQAAKSYGDKFMEIFKLIPNMVSIGLSDLLKDTGIASSSELSSEYVSFTDSLMFGIKKGLNNVGENIGAFVGNVYNFGKNAVDSDKIGTAFSDMENGMKFSNIAISAQNNASDIAQDSKGLVSLNITRTSNLIDSCKNSLSTLADNIYNALNLA